MEEIKEGPTRLFEPVSFELEAHMRRLGLIGIKDELEQMYRYGFHVEEKKDEKGETVSVAVYNKKGGQIIYFADLKELAQIKSRLKKGEQASN